MDTVTTGMHNKGLNWTIENKHVWLKFCKCSSNVTGEPFVLSPANHNDRTGNLFALDLHWAVFNFILSTSKLNFNKQTHLWQPWSSRTAVPLSTNQQVHVENAMHYCPTSLQKYVVSTKLIFECIKYVPIDVSVQAVGDSVSSTHVSHLAPNFQEDQPLQHQLNTTPYLSSRKWLLKMFHVSSNHAECFAECPSNSGVVLSWKCFIFVQDLMLQHIKQ